jgi:hypothetical protein
MTCVYWRLLPYRCLRSELDLLPVQHRRKERSRRNSSSRRQSLGPRRAPCRHAGRVRAHCLNLPMRPPVALSSRADRATHQVDWVPDRLRSRTAGRKSLAARDRHSREAIRGRSRHRRCSRHRARRPRQPHDPHLPPTTCRCRKKWLSARQSIARCLTRLAAR